MAGNRRSPADGAPMTQATPGEEPPVPPPPPPPPPPPGGGRGAAAVAPEDTPSPAITHASTATRRLRLTGPDRTAPASRVHQHRETRGAPPAGQSVAGAPSTGRRGRATRACSARTGG